MKDVIIIGAGGAGLSAGLSAKENSDKVLIISKTFPTHSQTVQAQGGINCVFDTKNDSIENHINDTYNSSKHLSNKKSVETMCTNAKETIIWLDNIGVPFSKDSQGNIKQRYFGGTKYKRTCYSADYTGLKILHTLYDHCIKENIDFLYEHILVDIIIENSCYKGVKILNLLSGEIINYYSKTLIIATGGYGNIYSSHTTNSISTTGDGLGVAFRNGLALSNLEFIQFHPTALKGSNTLISESARAEGAYLVDENEERFVDELATRDEVARAIKTKVLDNHSVYLDMRHLDITSLKEKMPQELKLINDLLNLNVEKDLIPITPAAHYTMGGILTNVSCETSVKNIYACGEVAQNNTHGANRLGGNSLLEIITFGKVAGINAAKKSKEIKDLKSTSEKSRDNFIDNILIKNENKSIYFIKKELGSLMFSYAGLFRTKSDLEILLEKIEKLEIEYENTGISNKEKKYNKNLLDYIELGNIILLSKLTTISALNREESRGSHYRSDFKNTSKEYEKISIIKNINKKIEHHFEGIL
ncbi:MAG: FAD-binding protein [Arcobacter sp.]|uniref:FAD-binding protein n=1 Tax=Arcobacter sp. TaxID=1872629 RepID=UPI003B00FC50